ncbi:hypothetical protein ABIB25_001969 [Nakamurella sp. UYEF19]|uniref:hypothetical protein n=1 Tax=Nakamurella sp. UYEF19 TaxID=1756392 RepID=UPI00339695D1
MSADQQPRERSAYDLAGSHLEEFETPTVNRAVLPGGGSWLRIMLALTTALTMVVLWKEPEIETQVWMQLFLMVGVGLWVLMRPGSAASAVLLVGALTARVFLGHPQLDGSLIALVVLLPLVHQLAALSAVVPLRSNVQWAALMPTGLRYFGAVSATVLGLILSQLFGWW